MTFFFVTLALVVLMGFPVVMSISAARPENLAPAEALPRSESRQPSSLGPSIADEAPAIEGKGLRVALPCTKDAEPAPLTTALKAVRLDGHTCQTARAVATSILNKTNGFAATIFPGKSDRFTTDYIELEPGENQIVIQVADADGLPQQWELTVIRKTDSKL
jgi:hypothetical protein